MALFDKLKDILVSTTNSLEKQGTSIMAQAKKHVQLAADPFTDLVVKQYYEIVCGMYETLMPHTRLNDSNFIEDVKVKKYIEHFIGEACDEESLNTTLELYRLCWGDYEKNKKNQRYLAAQRLRSQTMKAGLYKLDAFAAQKLVYPEEIVAAAAAYEKVLEVVKDTLNYKHFAQGMAKMPYNNHVKQIVVADSFCNGNPITKALVLGCVLHSLIKKNNCDSYLTLHYDALQMALRALHFESHRSDRDSYTALSDADYRSVVTQVPAFNDEIKDHPFEKEEYIEKFANDIKSGNIFGGVTFGLDVGSMLGLDAEFFIDAMDDYYSDAVCNYVWHIIDSSNEWKADDKVLNNSTDPDIMANIILAYVQSISQSENSDVSED